MWFVEGQSVRCAQCGRNYKRDPLKRRAAGYDCPGCVIGTLEEKWHTVDEGELFPIGFCDCMDFSCRKMPIIAKMAEADLWALSFREQEALRCLHLRMARHQSHNETLMGEVKRLAKQTA